MYKVHGFLDDEMVLRRQLQHLPRNGDTIRLEEERLATVTEVIWCMDEPHADHQRVNLRMKTVTD